MPGEIRSVTIDDAPAIQAIYAPFVTDTIISFETTPPTVEEMAGRIQKSLGKFPWLVYVPGGEVPGAEERGNATIAGYAYASAHRERAAYQWSADVSVYVHPNYHRRNIARGLYTALFALMRAQGYVNAYAGISLPNAASVGAHTALGFEPVGVFAQVGYKFGAWHDVGWWGLRLIDPPKTPKPPRPISDFVNTPFWSASLQSGLAYIKK